MLKVKGQCCGTVECTMKIMEDCFRDICNIGAGYERAKGYWRTDFSDPEALKITDVKTIKEPGLWCRCSRSHFQNNCTNHKSNTSNKFQNTSSTWQNYQGSNYTQIFHDSKDNSNMFPTGTLAFQAMQQIKSGENLSVSINTIKCFLRKNRRKI